MKSISTWEEAQALVSDIQKRGGIVVTTNGCFDLLHRGHLSYLQASRKLGDFLIVGINSDDSVKRLKGSDRPINSAEDRALLLASLRFVDAVCVFDEDTPVAWLKALKPNIHTKGADYRGKEIPETAALKEWNGKMAFIDFVDNYSTTETIRKMKGQGK